jgi:hypothetical protein
MARIYRLALSRDTWFSEVWLGARAATLLLWISEGLLLRGAGEGSGEIQWSIAGKRWGISVTLLLVN